MDAAFVLTNKQTAKLQSAVRAFYDRAAESEAIDPKFLMVLGGVVRAVEDEDPLHQFQTDVLLWVLDLLFAQMTEDEFDPLLEQAYCKLAGWWPVEPPWYDRV